MVANSPLLGAWSYCLSRLPVSVSSRVEDGSRSTSNTRMTVAAEAAAAMRCDGCGRGGEGAENEREKKATRVEWEEINQ